MTKHMRDKATRWLAEAEAFMSSFERWRFDSGVGIHAIMSRRIKELTGKVYLSPFEPTEDDEDRPQMETSKEAIQRIVRNMSMAVDVLEDLEPDDADKKLRGDEYDDPMTAIREPDWER
jgi:hypothetical protein